MDNGLFDKLNTEIEQSYRYFPEPIQKDARKTSSKPKKTKKKTNKGNQFLKKRKMIQSPKQIGQRKKKTKTK